MSNISTDSAPVLGSREKSRLVPHRITLVVMWVVTTAAIVVMLFDSVRSTDQHKEVRYVLQVGYVVALLWYLGRSGPSVNQLPEIRPQVLPRWKFGVWIPVLVIALLFALTLVSTGSVYILMLLMMVATGLILLAWRREIRLRSAVQGIAVALFAYLAGLQMANNLFISRFYLYLMTVFSFPMYIAGGLLYERTRLGGIQLLVTGLLYGVPMAAIFARRDWEHAVGAHYMVNMISWLMVFLET